VLSALDVEASALLSARLAAVEACNLEKSERTGNALARAVVARAKALATRYGVPRLRVHEGWLWNSTTVLVYDVAEAPLPELLRRLHEVALGPAAVRTGRGRAQDGAQEHVTAVDVAVDIDAVHAARIGLLTLPAKEAARCAWRSAGEGASAGAQYGAHGGSLALADAPDLQTDLARWHRLEEEDPTLFGRMHVLFAQKRSRGAAANRAFRHSGP
jgi:hypothetical protein